MILLNDKKKLQTFIGAVLSIFIVGIFTCFVYDKGMPTAEGWYSYYAKCILNGDIVYKDFEYLFTPVYMYIVAGFVKLFGYNIIALRIFGILVYAILTLIIFLILSRIFSVTTSVIATVTGMFYLQSEVYTVFYDYVRIMDIFAYLAILFMILTIVHWQKKRITNNYIWFWGLFTSFFFLVKQNMGGLFLVYSILLIIFANLYFRWNIKRLIINMLKFFMAFIVPVVILFIITEKIGITHIMIDSIFFSAMEAKGGITTILFRWIKNGFFDFLKLSLWGGLYIVVLKINEQLNHEYPAKYASNFFLICYSIVTSLILFLIFFNEKVGVYFANAKRLDVNLLFIVTVFLLFYLLIKTMYFICTRKNITTNLTIIGLLGAYFSICYGAGMSGGLSIGESALGLGIIICILIDSFKYKGSIFFRGAIAIYCMYLSFCCVSFKLVNPCQWWGIDTSSIYINTEQLTIPVLNNIKVSYEEKEMYENIVSVVQQNTKKNDEIFCFPHIPIFYLLCERNDSDVYTKVQWFDVSTKQDLQKDIEILEQNPPKALIIYNLNDGTYSGHEEGFLSGAKSGTRIMRDTLYEMVNKYNYEYQGNFISDSNNISVFTLRNSDVLLNKIFSKGNGTKENPYLISSVKELVNLAMLINQGYTFEDIHFKQICDIYLDDIIWVPIGYNNDNYFEGYYNYSNYSIYNINSSEKNSDNPFGNELFYSDKN